MNKPTTLEDVSIRRFGVSLCLSCGMVLLVGCGDKARVPAAVNPFDCELLSTSGYQQVGAEFHGDIVVEFSDERYGPGTAAKRMKGLVLETSLNWFVMTGCGRDEQNRIWELTASWVYLPVPASYPIEFDVRPRGTQPLGEAPSLPPNMGASLLLCGNTSCERGGVVDVAIYGPYDPFSEVEGRARVDTYDFNGRRFSGEGTLWYFSGPRQRLNPTTVKVDGIWGDGAAIVSETVPRVTGSAGASAIDSSTIGTAGGGA